MIDAQGLFGGERLAACSDRAKLYWPFLYLAANGYGRLELKYPALVAEVFKNFRKPPAEDLLWSIFEEYAVNFLVVLYCVEETNWWAQFSTSERFLPRYKTSRDEDSPKPPAELMEIHKNGYSKWKSSKSVSNQRFQKLSENFRKFPKISAGEERRGEELGLGRSGEEKYGEGSASAPPPAPPAARVISPSALRGAAPPAPEPLPSWLDAAMWRDFAELRKEKRAPLTPGAVRRTIRDLERMASQGIDPNAALDQSIQRGWTGVWPPRAEYRPSANGNGLKILSRPGGAA